MLVYTSVVGSAAAVPLLVWVEPFHWRQFLGAGAPAVWGIAELAVIVYGCAMLLFFYVLKRMDVTQAILGNYLLPFFIALFGVVLLRETFTLPMAVGGALVLASTLMVTVYENDILRSLRRAGAQE